MGDEIDELGKQLKRDVGYVDTAGVKDAAGEPIRYTLMPGARLFPPFGEKYMRNVKTTKMRADDILVCGFPKTGCHWTWELINMVLKGKAEFSKMGKVESFLEMANPELPAAIPSPRVLNTHFEYEDLPDEAKQMKTKIVFTSRNPKDTCVSLYNHHFNMKNIYNYNGPFKNWFPLFLTGKIDYAPYLDFHESWDKAIRENPDHPILVMQYERMKQDPKAAIRQLAKFVDVDLPEEVVEEIAYVTDIKTMKEKFGHLPTAALIRKGQVGDWKNWMTEEQSEAIDDRMERALNKTIFKPRYEPY